MSLRGRESFLALLSLFLILSFTSSACRTAAPPPAAPVAMIEVLPKIGIALGGGGARGFAHIGVLRVLEQEKIPIDVVVGASVGSLIGALYADSGRVLDAEFLATEVGKETFFDFGAMPIFSGGLARGEGIATFLTENLRHATFETMPVRFGAVATELRTGRTVVFEQGSVAQGVRASSAIPGVFVPVEIGGELYVDGGVTDPVPADAVRARGAEVVIAVAIPAAVRDRAPMSPTSGTITTSASRARSSWRRVERIAIDCSTTPTADAGARSRTTAGIATAITTSAPRARTASAGTGSVTPPST